MTVSGETPPDRPKFDFSAYPPDTLFHDRRSGPDRRTPRPPIEEGASPPEADRRERKERRRRVDPTTFEKQYSDDELEFMTAMQRFKDHTGRAFPTHGEVLRVALSLGYRKGVADEGGGPGEEEPAPLD